MDVRQLRGAGHGDKHAVLRHSLVSELREEKKTYLAPIAIDS